MASTTVWLWLCLLAAQFESAQFHYNFTKLQFWLIVPFFSSLFLPLLVYLQCWDECSASTSINKSILDTWALDVTSMVRDSSLVATNIAWKSSAAAADCLVTWEVSGGGKLYASPHLRIFPTFAPLRRRQIETWSWIDESNDLNELHVSICLLF